MTRRLVSMLGLGFCGLALVATPACRKSDDATRAAKQAREETSELRGEIEKKAGEAKEGAEELGKKADETRDAQDKFQRERDQQIEALNGRLTIEALNTNMLSVLADAQPLTDAGRETVKEKGKILAMRVNEAANTIEQLYRVGPDTWEAEQKQADELIKQVEQARNDGLTALREAPRVREPAAS